MLTADGKNLRLLKSYLFIPKLMPLDFLESWYKMVGCLLNGLLIGFNRTPDKELFSKTKGLLGVLPNGRVVQIELLLKMIAQTNRSGSLK